MSCEYAIHKFLDFAVAHNPGLQRLCQQYNLSESALVEAFETFSDAVRQSITAGQVPTAQQTEQYERMVQMMSNAGIALPDHASSPRMKILLSSLYEMLEGVAKSGEEGTDPDGRVGIIRRLARVNQSLNTVRPKVTPVPPARVDPNTIGYSREEIEAIAARNPIAAALLDTRPLPMPDWNGERIAAMREQIQASGARIDLPSPEQVSAFLSDPNRVPRPMSLEATENVLVAAERLAMNLGLWNQLIDDGYVSVDGRPSRRVPSSHLGGLLGITLFGPPGTGKSEVLRAIAACLPWRAPNGEIRYGVPYVGLEVPPNGEFGEVLGRPTYDQNGSLWFRPSVAVIAAMSGAVVAFDEIIRSRALISMLQAAWELSNNGMRFIRNPSAEGGMHIAFPVHPTTIFGATYNPGIEGLGWSLPSAFVDRSTTLSFKPIPVDQQVDQVAVMVQQMLREPVTEAQKEQIRTLIALVKEVNAIITGTDPRHPIIEARRLARLAILALLNRPEHVEHELFAALPPEGHPGHQHAHDALETILGTFRTRLSQHMMRRKRG